MLRLSGRRVPFCCGKNRVRRAAAVQTAQNRLPRACGEKEWTVHRRVEAEGSPPRVRGEESQIKEAYPNLGITPACAGRRRRFSAPYEVPQDHPRVCGEKYELCACNDFDLGSPPRVRGEVFERGAHRKRAGITPACAGRSAESRRGGACPSDHPRVCGEKLVSQRIQHSHRGSPPRARGEGKNSAQTEKFNRITPACAGRSGYDLGKQGEGMDHPRVRGEKPSK